MPELLFQVEGAEPIPYAASPLLALKLRINSAGEPIQSLLLTYQVRIEAARRRYSPEDQGRLVDLFGPAEQWGRSLRSFLWTHAFVSVPAFHGSALVDLPLPCSADFNVAWARYFEALEQGEVPLTLLFSGTLFYTGAEGELQVARIPWEKEATFRLPVRAWQETMAHYFPNSSWILLRQDVFRRLARYRSQGGFSSWEQALEGLLPPEEVKE